MCPCPAGLRLSFRPDFYPVTTWRAYQWFPRELFCFITSKVPPTHSSAGPLEAVGAKSVVCGGRTGSRSFCRMACGLWSETSPAISCVSAGRSAVCWWVFPTGPPSRPAPNQICGGSGVAPPCGPHVTAFVHGAPTGLGSPGARPSVRPASPCERSDRLTLAGEIRARLLTTFLHCL